MHRESMARRQGLEGIRDKVVVVVVMVVVVGGGWIGRTHAPRWLDQPPPT